MPSDRVIVLMKGFLGDAVMALPLIDGLLAEGKTVGIATTENIRRLLQAPHRNLQFIEMGKERTFADTRRVAREIRQANYEVALILNRSFRSAFAAFLGNVPTRSGHATDKRRLLLTCSGPYDLYRNEAESYLDTARWAGIDLPSIETRLFVTDEERAAGADLLQGADIGIQPGASYIGKRMAIPLQAQLIADLTSSGHRVALVGGNDELETVGQLCQALETPVVDLVGKTDLRQALGVLANLRLVIGGDTGLMHMAAAVGSPSFTIFSGKPASKWAHDYRPHRYIQAPDGNMSKLELQMVAQVVNEMLQGS